MENLKDTVSTICGVLFVICGAILGVQTEVAMPKWIITTAVVVSAISAAITMYMTGKNPNGTKKTIEQVTKQNAGVTNP